MLNSKKSDHGVKYLRQRISFQRMFTLNCNSVQSI